MNWVDRLQPGPRLNFAPRPRPESPLASSEHAALGALRLAFNEWQPSQIISYSARGTVYTTVEQHAQVLQELSHLDLNPLHETLLHPAKLQRQIVRDETSTKKEIDVAGTRLNYLAVLNQPFQQFEGLLNTGSLLKGVLTRGQSLEKRKAQLFQFYIDLALGDPGFMGGEFGKASFEEILTADFLAQRASILEGADISIFGPAIPRSWRIWFERQENPSATAIEAVNTVLKR